MPALIVALGCGSGAGDPDAGPRRLSQTALYDDFADKEVASSAQEFQPRYVLWSDGAEKRRWIRLPAGKTIDTSDLDHWKFPVGTQFYKEFSRDGKRLETRLIEKVADTGDDEVDFWMGAFVWNDDETEATFVAEGAENVRGTDHDVPSALRCWTCHIGEPGRSLGFSALQLAHDGPGVTLSSLRSSGRLSHPPPSDTITLSNDTVSALALGYLHANCGHCHNPNGSAWSGSNQNLRFPLADLGLDVPTPVASTVGVPLQSWTGRGYDFRVVAGSPETSALFHRLAVREPGVSMPPLATEHADPAGTEIIRSWIENL